MIALTFEPEVGSELFSIKPLWEIDAKSWYAFSA